MTPRPARCSPRSGRRARRRTAAAARQLALAARWAALHPPESIHHAAAFTVPGCEHEEPIAGLGLPAGGGVLASPSSEPSSGISSTAAKKLIGHALELRHRLPRLWAQVHAGAVPSWRARLVAEATIHTSPAPHRRSRRGGSTARSPLSPAASGPRSSTGSSPRPSSATTSPPPILPPIRRTATSSVDPRHVDGQHATTSTSPAPCTSRPSSTSPTPSTSTGPSPTAPHCRRHSGRPSRSTYAAPRPSATSPAPRPHSTCSSQGQPAAEDQDGLPPAREVVVHAHFDATTVGEQTVFGPTGRHGGGPAPGSSCSSRSRSWCGDSRTTVTIKPVIDLNVELFTLAYEIPDRIREQIVLRDRTCVFPWCTRPGRGCDVDHIVEFDHEAEAEGRPQPGPTTTSNLAALCRYHHRLKTFTVWTYRMAAPGVFEWTSPHGHGYRRDRTGTTRIDEPDPPDRH